MKYTMEEKLQAATRYWNKEETIYTEPQTDNKLPKYISLMEGMRSNVDIA
jgi:hypothetical protein